jgi:hypothetical protein
MADPMQAAVVGVLRTALADPTFFNKVGGRFVEAESPVLVNLDLPAAAIRFIPGRVRKPLLDYHVFNFQIVVYSDQSYSECRAVYNAFRIAMNGKRLTQDGVYLVIRAMQAPSLDTDPESEEFMLSCFWEVRTVG